VYSSNITPDPATGIGRWSSDDFWRALHHGMRPDGRLLNPAFPYTSFTLLRREDADALFAHLQSLPPVTAEAREHELRWPFGSQAALAVWRSLYFSPGEFQPHPQHSTAWNRGAYLSLGLAHCNACHGSRDALGGLRHAERMDGQTMAEGWYAPSLHAPNEASVAAWPDAELRDWLRSGVSAHALAQGPMVEVVLGSTRHLNDADLAAMATYLHALPQDAPHEPGAPAPAVPGLLAQGEALYQKHCVNCHGVQGEGRPGAYPALAGSRMVQMASPSNLVRLIQRGGFAPASPEHPRPFGMPPFAGELDARQLAALSTYLRRSWGHQASAVSPQEIIKLTR